MSKVKLLSTAAAIVLLSGSAVMAQGLAPNGKDNPARAPAAQQGAPAEKMGPAIQHKRPETTGQATPDKVEPGHGANAQTNQIKPQLRKAPETTSQEHGNGAAVRQGAEIKGGTSEHQERLGAGGNADHNRATTGQGAAGAAKLSHEQRTRMSTVFHQHRDHRIDKAHFNVSIRVGARVPTSVHFYPVPVEIVTIYPEWRGYDYVYVGDEILILDPRTHEIVAILEA
jgi:Protein of unknown function (DUF1236)